MELIEFDGTQQYTMAYKYNSGNSGNILDTPLRLWVRFWLKSKFNWRIKLCVW